MRNKKNLKSVTPYDIHSSNCHTFLDSSTGA